MEKKWWAVKDKKTGEIIRGLISTAHLNPCMVGEKSKNYEFLDDEQIIKE